MAPQELAAHAHLQRAVVRHRVGLERVDHGPQARRVGSRSWIRDDRDSARQDLERHLLVALHHDPVRSHHVRTREGVQEPPPRVLHTAVHLLREPVQAPTLGDRDGVLGRRARSADRFGRVERDLGPPRARLPPRRADRSRGGAQQRLDPCMDRRVLGCPTAPQDQRDRARESLRHDARRGDRRDPRVEDGWRPRAGRPRGHPHRRVVRRRRDRAGKGAAESAAAPSVRRRGGRDVEGAARDTRARRRRWLARVRDRERRTVL